VDDWVPVEVAGGEAEAELLCSVLRDAGLVLWTKSGTPASHGKRHRSPPPTRLSLLAQAAVKSAAM
jgi:hypothetical protein